MSAERENPEHEYDEASRASLKEAGTDEADTVPGRSGSGSVHPEPNPTGNVGLSDHSVADDPDQG
ncbi:hypothetical protein G7043_35895 [Lentzea sp. NEAU-D13]|uniref:Uncharacterized protein n=1 Tax=Lentzea alba TaxID=2714351 RepID=A0A7C9RV89_9PSEU|nr:hypothetical protein [Lentzea alba]NGY64311.1 hypothetical protein [Lentzea alba]